MLKKANLDHRVKSKGGDADFTAGALSRNDLLKILGESDK